MPRIGAGRALLLGALLIVIGGAYASLYFFRHQLLKRDYSGIADPETRIGYCMTTSLQPVERNAIAESTGRPADSAMYARVMPYALAGEVTPEKRAASRALLEREELRGRAIAVARRVADLCRYDRGNWPPGVTPLSVLLRWLENDQQFVATLNAVRQREPDAAARIDLQIRESAAAPS